MRTLLLPRGQTEARRCRPVGDLRLGARRAVQSCSPLSRLSTGPFPRRRPRKTTMMSIAAWRSWRSKEPAGRGGSGPGKSRPAALPGASLLGLPQARVRTRASVRAQTDEHVFTSCPPPGSGGLPAPAGRGESWCFQKQGPLEHRLQAEAVCGLRAVSWPDRGGRGAETRSPEATGGVYPLLCGPALALLCVCFRPGPPVPGPPGTS